MVSDEHNRTDENEGSAGPSPEEVEWGDSAAAELGTAGNSKGEQEGEAIASPSDLLEHLSRMMGSLEQAWSDALQADSAVEAMEDAAGVWQSFVTAFVRWNEQTSQIAKKLNVHRTMDRFPLDDAGLARLEFEPADPTWQYYQLQVASIYAFQNFLDSLGGLNDPTGYRIHLTVGGKAETETWWEAGAFSLVKRRATALASLLRQQEDCLRELTQKTGVAADVPGGSSVAPPAWVDPLSSAVTLTSQGFHTAALPYLLLALRSVLANAAVLTEKDLPAPLSPHLETIPTLTSLARPVGILEEACKRMGEGKEVNVGVAVPLAEEFGHRVQELTLNPPDREALSALALHEGTADG